MTFEYRNHDGDLLTFTVTADDQPHVLIHAGGRRGVHVHPDRIEEVVAGLRDSARTASGQQPDLKPHVHRLGNSDEDGGILDDWDNCRDPECPGPGAAEMTRALQAARQQPDPTTADNPVQLRWGLGDVFHGDDDTVTVCLSGPAPDRAPYWLELDPERAAALRDDLVAPAIGQPAEAQPADAPLSASERQFLTFALDQAANELSLGRGFTPEDEVALARFRRMAEEAHS